MTKHLTCAFLIGLAPPAFGFSCAFDVECLEADACHQSDFLAEVEIEQKQLVTDFGDLTIVAVKRAEALITLFATGDGAEYMMSVTPDAARMSVQMNEGPMMVGYLGVCEEAF